MSDVHQYRFDWSFSDHARFARFISKRLYGSGVLRSVKYIAYGMPLLIFFGVFMDLLVGRPLRNLGVLPALGVFAVFVFPPTQALLAWLQAWLARRADPNAQHPITFSLDEEGVRVAGHVSNAEIKWSGIRRVDETPQMFVFSQNRLGGLYVTKSVVGTRADIAAFRTWVKSRILSGTTYVQHDPRTNRREALLTILMTGVVVIVGLFVFGVRSHPSAAIGEAIEDGDLERVERLLDSGVDVNVQEPEYQLTPLMIAADEQRPEILEILLRAGADPNIRDSGDWTAVLYAASWGDANMIERLIAAGADPNTKNLYGQTPLMWAASNGDSTAVRLLIDSGADLDAKDEDGETALFWAARIGQAPVVQLLIDRGADSEARNIDGDTALDIVYPDVVDVLRGTVEGEN